MPGYLLSRPAGNAGAGSVGVGQGDVLQPGADLADVAAGAAQDRGGHGEDSGGDEHAAAGRGRHRRVGPGHQVLHRVLGGLADRRAAGGRAVRSRNQSAPTPVIAVARLGTTSTSSAVGRFMRGEPGDRDQDQQQPGAEPEPPERQQTADRGQDEHAAHDRADQDRLVLGPELPDRPLLHRRGRQVDDLRARPRGPARRPGSSSEATKWPVGDPDQGREDSEQGVEQTSLHAPCSERRPTWAGGPPPGRRRPAPSGPARRRPPPPRR